MINKNIDLSTLNEEELLNVVVEASSRLQNMRTRLPTPKKRVVVPPPPPNAAKDKTELVTFDQAFRVLHEAVTIEWGTNELQRLQQELTFQFSNSSKEVNTMFQKAQWAYAEFSTRGHTSMHRSLWLGAVDILRKLYGM